MASVARTRRVFVGGNWKCNGTRKSVQALVEALNAGKYPATVEAVVSPISLHLEAVQSTLRNNIAVSAQNCSRTGQGAFTGEISADQLKDFGIPWVILGHSERRQYYGENDKVVGEKVAAALKAGLSVIACIGETLDERKAEQTLAVCSRQIKAIAEAVNDWSRVVIAYEPVWAIGTGVTATPEQAQEVHSALRKWLADNVSGQVSSSTRIIYGGSVTAANCDSLISQGDIDGFLVGGASLKPNDFLRILNAGPIPAAL